MEGYTKYNKKTLAAKLGISVYILKKELQYMFEDEEIKKEFGKYRNRYFKPFQIEIIKRETKLFPLKYDSERNDRSDN